MIILYHGSAPILLPGILIGFRNPSRNDENMGRSLISFFCPQQASFRQKLRRIGQLRSSLQ